MINSSSCLTFSTTGKPGNNETVETILSTNKFYLTTIRFMSRSENINAFKSLATAATCVSTPLHFLTHYILPFDLPAAILPSQALWTCCVLFYHYYFSLVLMPRLVGRCYTLESQTTTEWQAAVLHHLPSISSTALLITLGSGLGWQCCHLLMQSCQTRMMVMTSHDQNETSSKNIIGSHNNFMFQQNIHESWHLHSSC